KGHARMRKRTRLLWLRFSRVPLRWSAVDYRGDDREAAADLPVLSGSHRGREVGKRSLLLGAEEDLLRRQPRPAAPGVVRVHSRIVRRPDRARGDHSGAVHGAQHVGAGASARRDARPHRARVAPEDVLRPGGREAPEVQAAGPYGREGGSGRARTNDEDARPSATPIGRARTTAPVTSGREL